jgi:heptosyltransferase-2
LIIKRDCRYFEGSKPCKPHKRESVVCESCRYYEPISTRILIIKLDSIGDVLRTTSVLPALKEKHPASFITWITRRDSVDLLAGNPSIDEILECDANALSQLLSRQFDLVLGLDAVKDSAALCAIAQGKEKLGFGLEATGAIYPLNQSAQEWYEMGLNDQLKRTNRKSYQQILLELCNLPVTRLYPPQLFLSEKEIECGRDFMKKIGLNPEKPIIGINSGSGKRWQMKSLPFDTLVALIKRLKSKNQVMLLGGPEEVERNSQLAKLTGAIDSGCNNTLRQFAGIVNQCSLIFTGDTLALHIALALQKKLVAFFGPTSHHEIELFSLGQKLFSSYECLCCYLPSCDKNPTCMDVITVDDLAHAAERLVPPV